MHGSIVKDLRIVYSKRTKKVIRKLYQNIDCTVTPKRTIEGDEEENEWGDVKAPVRLMGSSMRSLHAKAGDKGSQSPERKASGNL